MSLRIAGSSLKQLPIGGQPVQRIMLGTGASAEIVWEATIYPRSGSWGPTTLSPGYTTVASHTIAETGTYTLTQTVPTTAGANVNVRIAGPWGTSTGNLVPIAGGSSTVTTSQTLTAGAAIQFEATGSGDNSGNWSITKTAPLY